MGLEADSTWVPWVGDEGDPEEKTLLEAFQKQSTSHFQHVASFYQHAAELRRNPLGSSDDGQVGSGWAPGLVHVQSLCM